MDEKCCVSHVTRKVSKFSHRADGSFLRGSTCLIRQATPLPGKQIPWNSENKPELIFFKGPFLGASLRWGLSLEGNLRFKIDWASLVVGRKFTLFALFYFVFEGGSFQVQAPRGSLYLEERFNGGLFTLRVWGPSIWRGFMEGLIFRILRYYISDQFF